jgi:hypothetical protein
VAVELRDGESLAVDWHYQVYEDILDTPAIVSLHLRSFQPPTCGVAGGGRGGSGSSGSGSSSSSSSSSSRSYYDGIHTPLQRCLDKFTEQEKVDGAKCERCKRSDGNIFRSFSLWRLPPVLIVQLKRFQFDGSGATPGLFGTGFGASGPRGRKLNNHIDFPFEGFDLQAYLATSSAAAKPAVAATAVNIENKIDSDLARVALYGDGESNSDNTADTGVPSPSIAQQQHLERHLEQCTKYDLYSVVHHAGALGGGHYAATARSLAPVVSVSSPSPTPSSSATAAAGAGLSYYNGSSSGGRGGGGSVAGKAIDDSNNWYCFNDNIVTEVTDPAEICCPSAYVLFYLRQDMIRGDVLALLRKQLSTGALSTPAAAVDGSTDSAAAAAATPGGNEAVEAAGRETIGSAGVAETTMNMVEGGGGFAIAAKNQNEGSLRVTVEAKQSHVPVENMNGQRVLKGTEVGYFQHQKHHTNSYRKNDNSSVSSSTSTGTTSSSSGGGGTRSWAAENSRDGAVDAPSNSCVPS